MQGYHIAFYSCSRIFILPVNKCTVDKAKCLVTRSNKLQLFKVCDISEGDSLVIEGSNTNRELKRECNPWSVTTLYAKGAASAFFR